MHRLADKATLGPARPVELRCVPPQRGAWALIEGSHRTVIADSCLGVRTPPAAFSRHLMMRPPRRSRPPRIYLYKEFQLAEDPTPSAPFK